MTSRPGTGAGSPTQSRYRSAWWLPNAHLATLWGKLGRREPIAETRVERWDTPDGDFVDIVRLQRHTVRPTASSDVRVKDASNAQAPLASATNRGVNGRVHANSAAANGAGANDAPSAAPRIVMLHGLEGGLHSHYVKAMFREAASRGWDADLLLFRSCGSEPNRLPRSYHSGETSDAAYVLERLASENPTSDIGLVGVSLGGNVLCKLLGERGTSLPNVRGAVAMSVPFDLARASRHIGRGFGAIYEWSFLKSLIPKALSKIARHPELAGLAQRVQHARTLWEFDDAFTAPLHGFDSAADYYARSSSLRYLLDIRVPTLLLSAIDDPFLPRAVLEDVRSVATSNACVELEFTKGGGHVGFTAGAWPWKPWYYGEWRAAEFLHACFERGT